MKAKLIKGKHSEEYLLNMEGVGYITTYESTLPYKLSLKNCQAIERGYDLDELAEEEVKLHHTLSPKAFKRGIQIGFQKALELMGDKKFTEEDMKSFARNYYREIRENTSNLLWEDLADKCMKEHIQSLQQKEWEVEICCYVEEDNDSDSFTSPMLTNTGKPKLDADGCLILKPRNQ
jgi:hypothetical protein